MISPFDNLRVLDFSRGLGSSLATMLLADYGAEVICLEQPGARDDRDPGYIATHRNKVRLALDPASAAGRQTARDLLASADVAVFDGAPGTLERLGLDAVTLRARHPGLLHAWFPFYGERGRWSQLPPEDKLLQAVTGCAFLQMTYNDQPMWMVTPQLSYAQGITGAAAIAASLVERAKTGLGRTLQVSGLHAFSAAEPGAVRSKDMIRMGGADSRGGMPNYRLYQCSDGQWLFLATLTPSFFVQALEVIDLLDVLMIEGVDGDVMNLLRGPAGRTVVEALDAKFLERPRDAWLNLLQENGVPCGPVGRREEWFAGDTVRANGMRVELDHPELGRVAIPGAPVLFSDTPGSVRHLVQDTKPDGLGAHTPTVDGEAEAPPERPGPLHGITVLDFGQVIAGTMPASVLANFGAEVVKIEPQGGEIFRPYGLGFVGYNRGKRAAVIDLKQPEGREALYALVRTSDVMIDNFRVGVRERLGMDFASLAGVNPRIITCSVTGYGPTGPESLKPGFDPLLQAVSGIMAHQGGNEEPIFHQLPVNDVASAMMTAFAASTALYARERTGRGQDAQLSLANTSVICQTAEITEFAGRPPTPEGGVDCLGISALQRFYQCSDGWLAIVCREAEQFHALCNALGQQIWAGRYLADKALAEPRDGDLATAIAAVLAELPVDVAIDRLHAWDVPAAPAITGADMYDNPYLRANHVWQDFEHPMFGECTGVAAFARWDDQPHAFRRGAPGLGADTLDALREAGVAEERLSDLLARGIIAQGEG